MKKIAVAVAGLFLVSGCATTGQGGSQGQNAAAGAAIGAVAGCGLAVMLGGKCAEGAIVGGVAGAAIGWSYESKKVATAESVNAQARQAGVNLTRPQRLKRSWCSSLLMVKRAHLKLANLLLLMEPESTNLLVSLLSHKVFRRGNIQSRASSSWMTRSQPISPLTFKSHMSMAIKLSTLLRRNEFNSSLVGWAQRAHAVDKFHA